VGEYESRKRADKRMAIGFRLRCWQSLILYVMFRSYKWTILERVSVIIPVTNITPTAACRVQ